MAAEAWHQTGLLSFVCVEIRSFYKVIHVI